jgi:hypothetical protein
MIRCDVMEEQPEQGKHGGNDCSRDYAAKKTSFLPLLAELVGCDFAMRSIGIAGRVLIRWEGKKTVPALTAPECLSPPKVRQNVLPT